jgi:transcriptional regulator of arginine metabolism
MHSESLFVTVNTHAGVSALRRRDEILKVIREETIHSQEELQQRLASRGFMVTQPTLSRDLRDLGLAKSPKGYVVPGADRTFAAPPADREQGESWMERALRTFVQSVATASTLVVVKTPPAAAHAVGLAIDKAELPEVVGSVAGDDTVFLATVSPEVAERLAARLTAILERPRSARRAHP